MDETLRDQDLRRAREREIQSAFEAGQRKQLVDTQLNSHEARLNALNGSLERTAEQLSALKDVVRKMLDAIEARDEFEKEAVDHQISNRMFWSGIAMMIIVLAGVILAAAHI